MRHEQFFVNGFHVQYLSFSDFNSFFIFLIVELQKIQIKELKNYCFPNFVYIFECQYFLWKEVEMVLRRQLSRELLKNVQPHLTQPDHEKQMSNNINYMSYSLFNIRFFFLQINKYLCACTMSVRYYIHSVLLLLCVGLYICFATR